MELESLFGLPAHPLIVHAAVVLLPLAAIMTLVTAVVPRSRRHYAPVALALATISTIAVWLAQGSGESLEERVDETALVAAHTGQAERVLPWAIGLTVVAAAVAAAAWLVRRYPRLSPRTVTAALILAAAVAGVGSTWTIIDVGHSGAKATWSDVPAQGEGG
jgi:uncharacterized membrane protein